MFDFLERNLLQQLDVAEAPAIGPTIGPRPPSAAPQAQTTPETGQQPGTQAQAGEPFNHYTDIEMHAPPTGAAKAADTAAKLDKAMSGIGTDEVAIYNALKGLDPAEIAKVREEYQKRTGRKLDSDIGDELSGDDKKKAEEQLSGKEPVQGKNVGLNKYEMVPDDFKGELGPNQLRKSDYEELQKYDFDKFNVAPANGKPDPTRMDQRQFDAMMKAWLNISHGKGIDFGSSSEEDKEAFKQMLRGSMTDSPTFRAVMTEIGNDPNASHMIKANLGHDQKERGPKKENVFIDYFDTDDIDLDDLGHFSDKIDPAHKNDPTRGEQLTHILSERRYAAVSGNRTDFQPAHDWATDQHNQYRAERGQSEEVDSVEEEHNGKTYAVFTYADGTKKMIQTFKGQIVDMNPVV